MPRKAQEAPEEGGAGKVEKRLQKHRKSHRARKIAKKPRRPRHKLRKGQDPPGSEIHKKPRKGRAQKRPRRVGWVPKGPF